MRTIKDYVSPTVNKDFTAEVAELLGIDITPYFEGKYYVTNEAKVNLLLLVLSKFQTINELGIFYKKNNIGLNENSRDFVWMFKKNIEIQDNFKIIENLKDEEVKTLLIKGAKWNGKIYKNCIYIDNTRFELCNEDITLLETLK